MITIFNFLDINCTFDYVIKKYNNRQLLIKYAHHAVYDRLGNELNRAIRDDMRDMQFIINKTLFADFMYD